MKGKGMHPDLLKQALEALEKGDGKAATEILKGLIADAAGAPHEPEEEESAARYQDPTLDGDAAGSEGDGAEGVGPPPKRARLTAQQVRICREMGITAETFLSAQRALNRPMRAARNF